MSDPAKPAITSGIGKLSAHYGKAQTQPRSMESLDLTTHSRIEAVQTRAHDLSERAQAHYARHRETWVSRQYGELLKGSGNARDFTPSWAGYDKAAHLRRAAEYMVDHRNQRRQSNIQKVMTRAVSAVVREATGQAQDKNHNRLKSQDRGR